ncbi:AAA family ATPase [Acinetobacter nosocomialis]|uniref:AAA family ATPase n=1 Tax=Acinetobacter nosocomialis TaxID=106654 RepID=UPI002655974D|nr:ATP-binding protein [Acinetobacter nosocomialis]MDN8167216.1 AAA family ATPase [Acinetobacter baumannii]MDO7211049.1 AAA family ATPase [Acinetobacter nosocomialis]
MKLNSIKISEWQQFLKVEIDFHKNVTILTGANGSGKTTILKFISNHYGWSNIILAIPILEKQQGAYVYKSNFKPIKNETGEKITYDDDAILGEITYSNNRTGYILLPSQQQNNQGPIQFFNIFNQQNIDGLHVNSHRPPPKYSKMESIPVDPMNAEQAFNIYDIQNKRIYLSEYTDKTPLLKMKEALISMAAFGQGNNFIENNKNIESLFINFNNILKQVLPEDLGFQDIIIRIPNVLLKTETGEFLLDACSGGILSIIEMAWQIFLYSQDKNEFVVTLDEPENHLHPSMQRTLLNDFTAAFPNAQFIVATHSPFIVSSVKDSNVYALKYSDLGNESSLESGKRKVKAYKLDLTQKAATAQDILHEVLGVPVTLPKWADAELQRICSQFGSTDITTEGLERLKQQLKIAGLEEFYPDAIKSIVENTFND